MTPTIDFDLMRTPEGITLFTGRLHDASIYFGFAWGIIMIFTYAFTNVKLDILQWFIISLFMGSVMQISFFGLKKRRFRNPATNADLLVLFEEVKTELDKDMGIELWFRDTDKNVFLYTVNPLFKAILFSESGIADILSRRKKGKVALARQVLLIERASPIREFAVGLLIFTIFSLNSSYLLFELPAIIFGLISLYSIVPVVQVFILIFVGILIVPFLDDAITSRNADDVDRIIKTMYGPS